jgi:hypothetical protein
MKDNEKEKEKGDQNDCGQIEYASNSNKKLGEEKLGP